MLRRSVCSDGGKECILDAETKSAKPEKKKLTFLSIILIQASVIVYTGSSVCSKIASGHKGTIELFGHTLHGLTWAGFGWLFLELCCLGLYAILWQQIIKHFDLSVVYANRAFAVCWTMLWSVLLFGEHIKPFNIVGVLIVLVGIMLVNADAK